MPADGFEVGACADLGTFNPAEPDCGVAAWLENAERVVDWLVLMEDRSPDFFHGYRGFHADAGVPLNRHGPRPDAWTHGDLKRLVAALKAEDVTVLLGYWVHESEWIAKRHPELLIRDATGALWVNPEARDSDFNPMRRLRGDEEAGITDGELYTGFVIRQWRALQRDFGFDGLFLGDGAMGFRRHGHDWKDLRHFDYHEDWLSAFQESAGFAPHADCALRRRGATTREQAADVRAHHWAHWVSWNVDRWTAYYRTMADAVHATGGKLHAYNCMNYDPALARLHGVDYRAIAEAGLDVLVFQTYDWAWGPHGPFGYVRITRKDLATNLAALLETRAHVGFDTATRLVFTIETEDEVEHWDSPLAHTLGEAFAYGNAAAHDGERWRRAADGAFIVWANSVPREEWRFIADAARRFATVPPPTPAGARVWEPGAERRLESAVLDVTDADALYAHLEVGPRAGVDGTFGVIQAAHVARAFPEERARVATAPRARARGRKD